MAIALTSALTFVSCNSNDPNTTYELKTDIVKKWKYYSINFRVGQSIEDLVGGPDVLIALVDEILMDAFPYKDGSVVEFKNDGNMTITTDGNTKEGTYNVSDSDNVTTKIDNVSVEYKGHIINQTTLTLSLHKTFFIAMVSQYLPDELEVIKSQLVALLALDNSLEFDIIFNKL